MWELKRDAGLWEFAPSSGQGQTHRLQGGALGHEAELMSVQGHTTPPYLCEAEAPS